MSMWMLSRKDKEGWESSMSKVCRHSWIVYEDDKGKPNAIENDYDKAESKIIAKGYKILGYPAANKKRDAIWYIESLQPTKREIQRKKLCGHGVKES